MKTKRLSGFAFANVVLCAIFVMTSVAMGKDVHVPSPVPPGEGVLSLDAALQAAYSFNPALLASHHNINIASGHLKQAPHQ